MGFKQELFIPQVSCLLQASEVIKTVTAVASFSKPTSIVKEDECMCAASLFTFIFRFFYQDSR